jgi:hypothetical protein
MLIKSNLTAARDPGQRGTDDALELRRDSRQRGNHRWAQKATSGFIPLTCNRQAKLAAADYFREIRGGDCRAVAAVGYVSEKQHRRSRAFRSREQRADAAPLAIVNAGSARVS